MKTKGMEGRRDVGREGGREGGKKGGKEGKMKERENPINYKMTLIIKSIQILDK